MTVIGSNGTSATGTGLVGQACAQPFTVDADCQVTQIELLSTFGGFNGSDIVGIASAVAGSYSWLGKYTIPGFLAASATWRNFTLDATASLTAGVTYYLVNVSTAGANTISRGALQMLSVVDGMGTGVMYGAPGYASVLTNQQMLFRLVGTIDPVLALTATDLGDGTVQLDVTEAEHAGAVAYQSNFSAGVDSWTSGTDGTGSAPTLTGNTDAYYGGYTDCLRVGVISGSANPANVYHPDQYLRRTVSGLTNGLTYRVSVELNGHLQMVGYDTWVTGKTGFMDTVGVAWSEITGATLTYDFVAVGTSDDIEIRTIYTDVNQRTVAYIRSVTVTLVPAGLEDLQLQRTDVNGARLVRMLTGAAPDSAGSLTVIDAEPATTGLVTYVVRDGGGNTASDTITLDYPTPLIHPVGYTGTLDVDRVDGYEGGRRYQVSSDVLPIIGRQDPITTERGEATWSLRRGTLTFAPHDTYEDAHAAVDVYTAGRVVMLRQATHPGLDLYHVAVEIDGPKPLYLHGDGSHRWQVRVVYVEVGWPDGELRGDGDWTYDQVADGYLAYWNLPDAFATYADLEVGP